MRCTYLKSTFKSHYCQITFILAIALVTIFVPKKIFYGWYSLLGIFFILVTATTITCFIRNIKEKAVAAKASGASFLGILMIVLGVGALQACTVGAPVCGASIGAGVLALFFPSVALGFFEKYSILIIVLSILLQIAALYFMNCFKRIPKRK